MKFNSKALMILALTMIFSLVLSACGSDESANSNKPAKKKDVKLDFVWFSDGAEGEVMKSIIADYQAENTNVKIELIEVAYSDLSTKLKTTISGGKPPALARISTTEIGSFSSRAVDLGEKLGGVIHLLHNL